MKRNFPVSNLLFAGSLAAFALLALSHGYRTDDDTFSHFAVSVSLISEVNLREILTDTWNKPMTALVYGVSGQLGLATARLVSVALVFLATGLLADILRKLRGWSSRDALCFCLAAFVFQISLLPQIFLTNTEQLSAVCLTVALWLYYVKGKLFVSGLFLGMMVWARMESSILAAGWIAGVFLDAYSHDRKQAFNSALILGLGAAVPALGWWGVSAWVTGNPFWFRTGYVFVREPFFAHLFSVNFFTGLPGALSSPQLLLLCAGAVTLCISRDLPGRAGWRFGILLPVLFSSVFFTVMTVYPRSSGYGGWAIASLNARSYNILSPIFLLIAAHGYEHLIRDKKSLLPTLLLTMLLLGGHFFFQGAFPFLFGFLLRMSFLLLGAALLAGFLLFRHLINKRAGESGRLPALCLYLIVTAPVMVPFFWYPLRAQDAKVEVQRQFLEWYQHHYAHAFEDHLILQTVNGSLPFFAGNDQIQSRWVYPAGMLRQLEQPWQGPERLFLVEAGDDGALLPKYPRHLIPALKQNGYQEIMRFRPERGRGRIDRAIGLLSSRNLPATLVVYAKHPPPDLHPGSEPSGGITRSAPGRIGRQLRRMARGLKHLWSGLLYIQPLLWGGLFLAGILKYKNKTHPPVLGWALAGLLLMTAVSSAPMMRKGFLWILPRGVVVRYYRGTEFQKFRGWDVVPDVSILFEKRPNPLVPLDDFSAAYTAWLLVPETGLYTFATLSTDGVRVFIDGEPVLDNWRVQHWHESGRSAEIHLEEGRRKLRVEYFNAGGLSRMRLEWLGPGIPPRTIVGGRYVRKRFPERGDP